MLPGLIVTKTDNKKNILIPLRITDFNNKNYTLHPHSAFMRFVQSQNIQRLFSYVTLIE